MLRRLRLLFCTSLHSTKCMHCLPHAPIYRYLVQAERLIHAVHEALGKDRAGKHRLGKATDEEPTLGGLRIGKVHPEPHPDSDGQ
jgi:hypothetical protein